MLPTITQQQFDSSIRQFDLITRRQPAWQGWENQPGQEFVLVYNNKFYPVRHILAQAAKVSETVLDDLQALTYFQDKAHWKVQIVPAKYLDSPVSPVILPVAEADLYKYRLLEKQIELFKISPSDNQQAYESFSSPAYLHDERNYKDVAVELQRTSLSREKLQQWIENKQFQVAAATIRDNYQKENLLYKPWEVLPFINTPDEDLVKGLYTLLYGEGAFTERLQAWINLLGRNNPLCWPAATYHLMLHDPQTHIFVKPGTIGRLIKEVGSKLVWQPRTNAAFYQEIQRFSRALLPKLAPLGAVDMIDVQSFSWIVRKC